MYCCLGLLFAVMVVGLAADQSCYTFLGDSYLEFTTSSLDVSDSVHYTLKFRTNNASGILLYSEGSDDYEALFIYGGKLVYLLTNPSPSGVEGTIGGFYQGNVTVNNGAWYTVELWRNWITEKRAPLSGEELTTGMVLYDDRGNKLDTRIDHLNHRGVFLDPIIYLGGISASVVHVQGSQVPQFTGKIKAIKEEKNALNFNDYSFNFEVKVQRCS